jgi:hypothetical protein
MSKHENITKTKFWICRPHEGPEEFEFDLIGKLKDGMTLDNYCEWEIDHIKACANFDLTKLEEQKQCFHYTNLQPLFKTTEIAESFGYINQIGNRNKNKY